MIIFYYFFIFFLGACFGSFLNVLVDRTQKGKKMTGFSKCDFCGYKLKWFDNIPILSFFVIGGKCRKCKKKLSWQYPIVEATLGILFVLVFWQALGDSSIPSNSGLGMTNNFYQFIISLSFYFFIIFIFAAIFLWDLKYMIIPNELVIVGTVGAIIFSFYEFLISKCFLLDVHCNLTSSLIGGLVVFLFFFLMFYFSKGKWIGGGDVKLGFLIGFLVGWEKVYLMLMISYILGGILAVVLIANKKKKMKSQIPFGPFLLIGCLVTLLWGERILDWYYRVLIF